jgi:hypothetical protein
MAVVCLGPKPAVAQVLQGYLLDDSTGVGIDGATVSLIRGDMNLRSVVASSSGWFSFILPDSGSYRLRAQRLGYATTRSEPLFIPPGDTVTVEFRLRTEAVQMAPLVVTASRARGWGQFRERMENWGKGIYMTPAVVDSIDPRHPADVFRKQDRTWLSWDWGTHKAVPKIRTFMGSGCVSYLLDGMPIETRMWGNVWEESPLAWIEGKDVVAVEYYRYIGEVPPELRRFADDTYDQQCGLVVFWTAVGW